MAQGLAQAGMADAVHVAEWGAPEWRPQWEEQLAQELAQEQLAQQSTLEWLA